MLFFGNTSIIGKTLSLFQQSIMFTWWAAVFSSVVVAFPLMLQTAKQAFLSVDQDIINVARVDGANEFKVFWKIEVPLTLRQLLAGIILSFTRGFGEFGSTFMFAGNIPGETQTIPVAIYVAYEIGDMQNLVMGSCISFYFLPIFMGEFPIKVNGWTTK
ncbi:ABC-type molybdate transport system permease subunit [Neobacillus sp. B4I6]